MKNIVRNSPFAISVSIWILWSNESTFYTQRKWLFSTIHLLSVPLRHRSAILEIIHWTANCVRSSVWAVRQGCVFFVCLQFDLNGNSASLCLLKKKVVIFIFFVDKKYSGHFRKYRLNHWWQMDYPGDAFHTFLDLDSESYLAVNGTVTSLPVFIQNIVKCVPTMNKAFTGLERHGGKWLMTTFSFWGGVTL